MGKVKRERVAEMDNNSIALDKGKQSALTKAVKKIKKGKGKGKILTDEPEIPGSGIIKLEHIPHGFYEEEIKSYFSQFGKVTQIKVARSFKTGKSRGRAYVEFQFEEVAKIAAQAMNNYLMFERLIKCEVLPATVNRRKLFKNKYIREDKNPKVMARKKNLAMQEQLVPEEQDKVILQQRLDKLEQQNKRLAEMGINYSFTVKPTSAKQEPKGKTPTKEPGAASKKKTSITPPKMKMQEIITPKRKSMSSSGENKKRASLEQQKANQNQPKSPATPKIKPETGNEKSRKKSLEIQMETPQDKTLKRKSLASTSPGEKKKKAVLKLEEDKVQPPKKKQLIEAVNEKPRKKSLELQNELTKRKSLPSPGEKKKTASLEMPEEKVKTPKKRISGEMNEKQQRKKSLEIQNELLKRKSLTSPGEKKKRVSDDGIIEKPRKKSLELQPEIPDEAPSRKSPKEKKKTPNKFSPKVLRSRKSVGPQQQTPVTSKKGEKKSKTPAQEEKQVISPKQAKNLATSEGKKKKTPEKPKFSPKLLRSRKSQGPAQQDVHADVNLTKDKKAKTPAKAVKELPRISPKLLRSRKSDAASLTPMKEKSTPVKAKKAGRKSVF